MEKRYLGDGVYVAPNHGDGIVLTTENGVSVTNTVVLESAVWEELLRYVSDLAAFYRSTGR